MEAQHLGVVHLVDVIARQHDDVSWCLTLDGIQVLIDGVSGPEIPVLTHAFLGRQDLDELTELLGDDAPPHPHVAAQREGFVLGGDEDSAQPGVDAVAEREVDDAVGPAEVNRRFGSIPGQWIQAFSCAASQQDDEDIVEFHDTVPAPLRMGTQPRRLEPSRRGGDLSTPVAAAPPPFSRNPRFSGPFVV